MLTNKPAATVKRALMKFDRGAQETFEPYVETPPVRALDWFSKLGDQPELRLIAGAMIVGGVFAATDRLVRAGARMIIAHETATLAKDLTKTEIDRTRPRSADDRRDRKLEKGKHTAK